MIGEFAHHGHKLGAQPNQPVEALDEALRDKVLVHETLKSLADRADLKWCPGLERGDLGQGARFVGGDVNRAAPLEFGRAGSGKMQQVSVNGDQGCGVDRARLLNLQLAGWVVVLEGRLDDLSYFFADVSEAHP